MDCHVGRGKSRAVTSTRPSVTLPHFLRKMGQDWGSGRGLDRRATFWWLYLPPLFWLGAFFLVPLLLMLAYSFRAQMSGDFFGLWQPSLKQYSQLFATGSYWRLLGTSGPRWVDPSTAARRSRSVAPVVWRRSRRRVTDSNLPSGRDRSADTL